MRVLAASLFLLLGLGRRITVNDDDEDMLRLQEEEVGRSEETVDLEETYGSKGHAISFLEAEHIFKNWRQRLAATEVERSAAHGEMNATDHVTDAGTPARLFRAIMRAATPMPSIAACLTLHLDLSALGFPGVTLTISFRGEIAYNVCTECFTWNIQTNLAFQWGLTLPGIGGIQIGYDFDGSMQLEELPCSEAEESSYCRYLHLFLPLETKRLKAVTSKCNTDSPFEVLSAYISYAFRQAEQKVSAMRKSFYNSLDEQINTFSTELNEYLGYFAQVHSIAQSQPQQQMAVPILVATCRWADGLRKDGFELDMPDPLCQIEIVPAIDYGARGKDKCQWDGKKGMCVPDAFRCAAVAGVLPSCRDTSEYDGEIWRSSFFADTRHPNWNEGYGFYLPMAGGLDKINLAVTVWDWNWFTPPDLLGNAKVANLAVRPPSNSAPAGHAYYTDVLSNASGSSNKTSNPDSPVILCENHALEFWITCVATADVEFQVELEKPSKEAANYVFSVQVDGPVLTTSWPAKDAKSQPVRLRSGQHSLRLISRLPKGSGKAKVCPAVRTLKTASDKSPCKFPSRAVLPLKYGSKPAGMVAVELEWMAPEKKGPSIGKWRVPLNAMSAAVEGFVGKLPDYAQQVLKRVKTPKGDEDDIEADLEYETLNGRFMARYKNAKVRGELSGSGLSANRQKSREIPDPKTHCKYDPKTKKCNDAVYCKISTGWFGEHKNGCEFNMQPMLPCFKTDKGGKCEKNGLCYNERKQTCAGHAFDCKYGTNEDKNKCNEQAEEQNRKAADVNQDRGWDPMRDLKNAYGHLDEAGKTASYVAQGIPCASWSEHADVDERVVDFERALKQHKANTKLTEELDFYAEFVTSAANLFIRTVADVQAIFGLYFAGDPNWDGDCLTVRPHSQIPAEFADDDGARRWGTQPHPSPDWMTHETLPGQKAGDKGEKIKDDSQNPWCRRAWASESRLQVERQSFAHRDAPSGLTGLRTNPRELESTMLPHFWCETLLSFHLTEPGKRHMSFQNPEPEPKTLDFSQGWDVEFRNACNQLWFEEKRNKKGKIDDGVFTIWRRYDCEKVLLTAQFISFFPSFITDVLAYRRKIGIVLENVLLCAGRIIEREFDTPPSELDRKCDVSVDFMLRQGTPKGEKNLKFRVDFLKAQAVEVLKILHMWLTTIKYKERDLIADFQDLWDHGQSLTGAVYTPDIMNNVLKEFNSKQALTKRVEKMKAHLVMKAWTKQGQKGKMFPPPVKYAVTLTVPTVVPEVSTKLKDICRLEIPQSMSLGALKRKTAGKTYIHGYQPSHKSCYAGTIAPLSGIMFGLEACSAMVMVEEEEKVETSYIISLRSVLDVENMLEPQKKSLTKALTPTKLLDGNAIKGDEATSSVAWHVGKTLMTKSSDLLKGLATGSFDEVLKVAGRIVDVIKNVFMNATHSVVARMKKAASAVFEVATLKAFRLLDLELHFVKVGDEDWTPQFYVYYKRTWDASISISIPSVFSITGHLQASQRYDLSSIFSEIYHAFTDTKAQKVYHRCIHCFETFKCQDDESGKKNRTAPCKTKQVFCFNAGKIANSKCLSYSREKEPSLLCKPAKAIIDSIDCAGVDDGQDE